MGNYGFISQGMLAETILKYIANDLVYDIVMSIIYLSLTYVATKIINGTLSKLRDKFTEKKGKIAYISLVFSSIKEPLCVVIWIYCLYLMIKVTDREVKFLGEIITILFFYILFWVCTRFIRQYSRKIIVEKEKKGEIVDRGSVKFFRKLAQVCAFFIVSLFCLARLGVNVQGIMTIGGVSGIVIGLGAQDLMANFFGTLSIYLNRPFSEGDWINSPDRKIEGFVKKIGWRQTIITSFGRYPIYVANSIFNNIIVENRGRMICRMIQEYIPVSTINVDNIQKTTAEIREMLRNMDDIRQDLFCVAYFETVSKPASLNLRLLTYTTATDLEGHLRTKEKVMMNIMSIIKKNGGEIAYDVARITLTENRKIGETIL